MISSQFENNYFTEMCSGSETSSYLRLIDFVYHSTLGLRVIKKKKNKLHSNRWRIWMKCSRRPRKTKNSPLLPTKRSLPRPAVE